MSESLKFVGPPSYPSVFPNAPSVSLLPPHSSDCFGDTAATEIPGAEATITKKPLDMLRDAIEWKSAPTAGKTFREFLQSSKLGKQDREIIKLAQMCFRNFRFMTEKGREEYIKQGIKGLKEAITKGNLAEEELSDYREHLVTLKSQVSYVEFNHQAVGQGLTELKERLINLSELIESVQEKITNFETSYKELKAWENGFPHSDYQVRNAQIEQKLVKVRELEPQNDNQRSRKKALEQNLLELKNRKQPIGVIDRLTNRIRFLWHYN